MEIKDLKEIKDKIKNIENEKAEINISLSMIENNNIIRGVFNNILETIGDNIEINKYSLLANYDYIETDFAESKSDLFDNIDFVFDMDLIDCINFKDLENTYKIFVEKFNEWIIKQMDLSENIDLNAYNSDFNKVFDKLYYNIYDYKDFGDYLDKIFKFYDSLNNVLNDLIKKYGL